MPKRNVRKVRFSAEEMASDLPRHLDPNKLRYVGLGVESLQKWSRKRNRTEKTNMQQLIEFTVPNSSIRYFACPFRSVRGDVEWEILEWTKDPEVLLVTVTKSQDPSVAIAKELQKKHRDLPIHARKFEAPTIRNRPVNLSPEFRKAGLDVLHRSAARGIGKGSTKHGRNG